MTGRSRPRSSYPIWCSTRPSRGLYPTRSRHFCQLTAWPSTVKLGPSGWVISIGRTSSRRRACAGRLSSSNISSGT